ncbi:hypothetical protein GOP47_0025050 [Adiantum capillus-veneris]|uniref:Uncharacterized protein n=1 Tax=Adiantum capillus-veneris TaxID=13818 RepID=A0A9D4U3Z0_ADICA|nr:hypothetical protein GOP47_0025050 [Adiantum capillus-veneris]
MPITLSHQQDTNMFRTREFEKRTYSKIRMIKQESKRYAHITITLYLTQLQEAHLIRNIRQRMNTPTIEKKNKIKQGSRALQNQASISFLAPKTLKASTSKHFNYILKNF